MESNPDNQHWLRSLFERNVSAASSDLETPINKTSLDYDDLLELQFLGELDLSNKQLTLLPSEIGNFSDLTYLYLHNNNLKELPKEIVKLTHLRNLTLHKNPNLILTDEQNKWLKQLKVRESRVSEVEPIIHEVKIKKEPIKVKQPKQKPNNIPTLDEWMDAEKKRFVQTKVH